MKKINIVKVFLAVGLIFNALSINAQNALESEREGLPYNIPTPTMSNLGSYGTVPVSAYTGKADVSIPITTMNERGVEVNVKLSYDTSGLLINQLPGWTGHGWTLMAGGAITRKINNYPDELSWGESGNNQQQFTGYFKCASSAHKDEMVMFMDEPTYAGFFDCDFSADIFYFNFLGKSGSFFMGTDGEWKVACDENICVIFDVNDESNYIYPFTQEHPSKQTNGGAIKENKLPKTIKGFTLVDSDGYRYTFGGKSSSIEYSTDLMSTAQHNISSRLDASSWMLTDIQDRFGNNLYSFSYSRGKYLVQICNADCSEIVKVDDQYDYTTRFNYSATMNAPVYLDSICSYSGNVVHFVREEAFPDTIASHILYPSFYNHDGTPNGKLSNMGEECKRKEYEFYYLQVGSDCPEVHNWQANTDANKPKDPLSSMEIELLNKISVCNGNSNCDYRLHYDYNRRIHLDSICVQAAGQQVSSYSLEYNRYDLVPQDYLTDMYDYWGYYNGVNHNQYNTNGAASNQDVNQHDVSEAIDIGEDIKYPIIHTDTIDVFAPSLKYTKYGMLKEITYPTGGKTQLEYELNEYNRYVSADRTAVISTDSTMKTGGLRIKQIKNLENGEIVSSFRYDYLSSGTLYNLPQTSIVWNTTIYKSNVRYGVLGRVVTSRNSSVIPLSNSFTPHIGYEKVKEINNDGFKIYSYTKMEDSMDLQFCNNFSYSTVTPYTHYSERDYLRGKLIQESTYDNNASIISDVSYQYTDDRLFNVSNYVLATNISFQQYGNGLYLCGNTFQLYYPKILLKEKISKVKMNNKWITDIYTYNYDDIMLSIKTAKQDSIHSNIMSLSSQVLQRGTDSLITEYYYPYSNEDINLTAINNSLISQYCLSATSVKRIQQDKTIDQTYTIFGNCNGNVVPKYTLMRYGELSPIMRCDTIAKYVSYNYRFRPTEVIDKSGINYKYYWDAKDRLVAIMANGSDAVQLNTSNNALNVLSGPDIFGNKAVDVTTCIYNNFGQISDIATGNRQAKHYDYDLLSRLVGVKDQNNHKQQSYRYRYKTSVGDGNLTVTNQPQPISIPKNITRYPVE